MTAINQLVSTTLDEREFKLAEHLAFLLDDDKWDAASLILDMIPNYLERVKDVDLTLEPDNVYRPLYYIHTDATVHREAFRQYTRSYMHLISAHLEGCLIQLNSDHSNKRGFSKTFGPIVMKLKNNGILNTTLADRLFKFNDAINVPSKHFDAYAPTRRLDERTFSVIEASGALIVMRKLSMKLFDMLDVRGEPLPTKWPAFKEEWLSWDQEIIQI